MTVSETWQLEPGARVAPLSATCAEVGVVAEPLQVLVRLLGDAIVIPEGRLSVNAMPLSVSLTLLLLAVRDSVLVAPNGIVLSAKLFASVGGLMTVMLAEAVFPVMPPRSVADT